MTDRSSRYPGKNHFIVFKEALKNRETRRLVAKSSKTNAAVTNPG